MEYQKEFADLDEMNSISDGCDYSNTHFDEFMNNFIDELDT